MLFMEVIRRAAGDVFGESLFELPWALLSECDDIESLAVCVILALVLGGVLVVLLGMVTMVSERLFRRRSQRLGLK
jgi:hypothetical protein